MAEAGSDGGTALPSEGNLQETSLAEARHLLLAGNRLAECWRGRDRFVILETGFGIGLTFLAAWEALRDDPHAPARLHVVSTEAQPMSAGGLQAALAPYASHADGGGLAPLASALVAAWPPPMAGFHRLIFDGGRVTLTLLRGEAEALLPQLDARADALCLEGHAIVRQAGLWSLPVIQELARLAAPGASLATRAVAQGVRAALAGAGFRVTLAPGARPGREMLVGTRDGDSASASAAAHGAGALPAASGPSTRQAAIIGAGLAGSLCAERLAARGWAVTLIDSRPAQSAAPAGLLRPVLNLRDTMNAQVSRPAFLYALQYLRSLQRDGYHPMWFPSGILQLANDEAEAQRMAAIAAAQAWPPELLRFVDAAEAADIAGCAVRGAGWWIGAGAWASPVSLCAAALARGGDRIGMVRGRAAESLAREGDAWQVRDGAGTVLAEAPVVVVANAHSAAQLVPAARLGLTPVRGQVTVLPPGASRRLGIGISGNGYVAPAPDGGHVIGASFDHDDESTGLRDRDHVENLARAESMLPGFTAGVDTASLGGWAGVRATVRDRLPIVGEGAAPGLWFATGLGSRGLLWASLGAELIAGDIDGDPRPLPRALADALSPRRFLS